MQTDIREQTLLELVNTKYKLLPTFVFVGSDICLHIY